MSKLKNKKYIALLGIIVLVIGIISLLTYGKVDKYRGLVKVKSLKTSTRVLSSIGNAAGLESKGYDIIKYTLTYSLDEIDGVQSRDVVIKGRLTDVDFKYAKFKEITGDNYSSTLSEDGQEIEITVNDVPLGQTQTLDVKIVVEGAPNGTKIKPIIEIKESTGSFTRANTEEIEVKTNSLQGKVTDKANNPISSIELSINSNGEEVKRTYTNDNGEYTFTDLSEGNYTIKVEEEIFELVGEAKVNVKDNSELNLTVQSVTPYSIETHKYIKNLNLIVNGKEFNYSYKDAEKVIQNVKNAKTIEGQVEYKIVVKNNGEKAGTITQVIDEAGEGLKFNPDKNNGWVEEDEILKYKPIEGSSLKGHQTKEIKLILDITKTSEIKTYLNKLTAKGEIYEKVVYIIDGQKFSEEDILQGEKANKPVITLDNFTGWFTDKNYTNKYNFNFAVNKDLILYGYTLTSKCKVTFIDRGELYQEQEVTCGDKATKPTDPSHEGYAFKAWKTANDNTFDFNTDIESDITLYSSYDLINYNINYNYNGGTLETGKTNPSSYTIETPDFTINNPSKPGYRFIGWTERTGDTPSTNYTIRTGTTGDKTLTANYSIIEYDITYDLDGGNLEEGKTNKNKYTIETETFTLNNPSKEGYTFEGWTGTDLNTATKTVTIPQGSMGDRHYTATYKPIEYTITYEGLTNDEKTALSNPVKYTIETDTITLNNPTNRVDNDGDVSEIFVGWTGSGVNDPSMSISIPKGSTGNKTYTAHWIDADPDVYPITYELNGGTLGKDGEGHDITNPSSYTKKTNDFTLNNPKKKGYDFTGWSGTDLVGNNNTTVTIVKGSRGPRTYTANYTPKVYNIVYNLDGGSLAAGATNPDTYTIETPDITLNDPSKLGYTFIGWEGTDVDTPTTPVKILQGSTGDREYTAKYTKDKYNITYDLDGGTLEEGKTNPIEYYVDTEDFTLNNPSKTGYRFIGWTYREVTTPEETVTVVKGSTGDIHFVAHYELIEYNITYNLDGGNLAEGVTNPDKYTIETETFTLNNPTKEGAKFTGWTGTELSGKSTEVTVAQGSTGDREYTATWGPNVYLVKFINNGNLYRTASVNYMDTVERPTDPTKDNYSEFKYWSTENKSFNENPVEFDFSTQITQDYTLYAIYQEVDPPVITHTPTYWTNQNVTVTITSDHDDYTYMEKLDDGSYASYSGPFEVEQNGTVYAYSVKGSKQSIEVTHDITNIDKIKPRINNLSASGVNMTAFTINVAASDDESGIRSITLYKDDVLVGTYLYDDEDTGEKIKSVSLSNLEENTTYHIKAITTDKAGNESDAFEKDIKTEQLIVARIIGENNELWEEERYINFPSLKEAIEYPDCVSSQCTIQMVQGTNESNIVLDGQDITLDLNGKIIFGVNENYTIQNSGKFTIIDNNEDEEGILYNQNGTALVNVGENSVFTLGVNDEELNVSITKPKIVGKVYGVNKVEGKFNFYDGYIEGTNAIVGSVDDTPYLHNARVSSIAQSDATIKQKAILSKVADAEARIGSVYYTKLADAIDKSNIGTIETTVEEKTMQDSIITYGDYGFTSRDGVLVPEDDDHIVESKSIIPIDLTDATEDQVLMLKMGLYKDHLNVNTNGDFGKIYITDELGTSSDVNLDLYTVRCYTDGECVKGNYSSFDDKQSISLSKGKKYYLYLEGDVKLEEINIGTTSMKSITNAPDYSLTNDGILYGFEYDETTKTLRSNNNYKDRTTAYSYIEVDLTNETEEFELATNVTFDIAYSRNNDYGFIVIREDSPKYDPKHYNLYQSDTFVYLSSYYSYRENDRSYLGSRDYKYTFAPGKKYYVEFYYYKADFSSYSGYPKTKADYDAIGSKDEFVINRFDVYKKPKIEKEYTTDDLVTPGDYGFRIGSNTTNCYVTSATNTTAHSYIKIDSSDVARRLGLQFYHSSNSDFYMAVTESTDIPTKDEAFYVGGSRYVSNTGGYNEDTYNVNLKTGKDLYLHFVYNRDSNNNCPYISSVKLFEGWGSTDEDIKTYGDAGFNSTSTSGYIYRYNDEIMAGDAVDSYVKVDLRNATEDQVAYMTYYNYTTSVGSYVYVTDTPKDLTYNYVKSHKEETVFFLENGQSYYYNGNKNYKSTSSYFLAHPMLLPKGRVYYIHLGGLYESSSGSYSGTGVYINSVTTQPLRDLKIHIGNTVKVLHGNKASGSAISDPNIVFDETTDNNIRYIGSDAKNHITFNNEDWRIIGIFDTEDENGNKDQRLKIMREEGLPESLPIDSTQTSNNNESGGINEWSQADAMKLLNPGYSDETVGGSLYYNKGSGNCYVSGNNNTTSCNFASIGLSDEAKDYIDEVKWNTGAVTTTEFTAKELYEAERGNDTGKKGISKQDYYPLDDVERTTSWVGKVGLIYPSDFVYSVDGASWSDDEGSHSYTRDDCIDGFVGGCYSNASWMWLDSGSYPLHTITPSNVTPSSSIYVSPGKPTASGVANSYNLNPVVYLSDKVIISGGEGTSGNPYTIELGESKNTDNDYGLVEKNQGYAQFSKDNTDDENYRFFGANPNNYIRFNNEIWRIIGIFKTEDKNGNESYRIKIMRKEKIGNFSYDSSRSNSNSGNGINEWSQADLMKILNPGYTDNIDSLFKSVEIQGDGYTSYQYKYDRDDLVNNSLYWNKSSGLCYSGSSEYYKECDFTSVGLSNDAKKYIDTVKWNLGAIPFNYGNITPYQIYDYERGDKTGKTDYVDNGFPGDTVERNTYWYGKVALPYISDYIMASGNGSGYTRRKCLNTPGTAYGDCSYNNNWAKPSTGFFATLSPLYGASGTSNSLGFMNSFTSTTMSPSPASSSSTIRPALYLSTKTIISGGTGTSDDPYTIELGEEKNTIPYYGLVEITPEPGAQPVPEDYQDIETDDYNKIKGATLYGFAYDKDTNTYIPENASIKNSVASSTIEIDLTNETASKRLDIAHNYAHNYFTFLVITETPDPIFYHPDMPTGYGTDYMNKNLTSYNQTIYLDPGKKYYIHLGYMNWDYYYIDSCNSQYGAWTTQLTLDSGDFSNNNIIKTYTYERNDDVDTVQILKNISLDYNLEIEKNRSVVLDLNGYTLNSVTNGPMVRNYGELEIIDSKLESDPASGGKMINNNGAIVLNNKDANLILTSGNVESNYIGVDNMGNLTMKEDFTIGKSSVGINNQDGVIDDMAGNITASNIGIDNEKVNNFNGDDSGTIKSMSGPLEINSLTGTGIKNTDKVSNATISANTGIDSQDQNLSINNTLIKDCRTYGIDAKYLTSASDVTITCTNAGTGIYAGIDDDSEIENITSTAGTALYLKSGNLVYDDNSELMLNGGISNAGDMVINLLEREVTDSIVNNGEGTMVIKSLADTDTNNQIVNNENGILTMNEKPITVSNILARGAHEDIKKVTTTDMTVKGKDANFEDGSILRKLIVGFDTAQSARTEHILNIKNSTVGTSSTADSDVITYSTGTINSDNSTFYGTVNNLRHGTLNLNNNSEVNNLVSAGYYRYSYSSRYSYYYGQTEVNVNNSKINGSVVIGTQYPNQCSGSTCSYSAFYDYFNLSNNSEVLGNIQNYKTGYTNINDSKTSTIQNDGHLTLGTKGDGMNRDSVYTEKITNNNYVDNYASPTAEVKFETVFNFYDGTINSTDNYPVYSPLGEINEIETNYYLDQENDGEKNVMFLNANPEVCKIGDTKYPSIGKAIEAAEENTDTPVTIEVIRDHPSRENIINNKNILIDFKGFTVNEYEKNYIVNNGNMTLKAVLNNGYVIHGGATSADKIPASTQMGDMQINNYGDMVIDDLTTEGIGYSSNGTFRMKNGGTHEVAAYTIRSTTVIEDGAMDLLMNEGDCLVEDIRVSMIHNSGNIIVERNSGNSDQLRTEFTNFNKRANNGDAEKNVWIKRGSYKFIKQQPANGISSPYNQTIKVGIPVDSEEQSEVVTVKDYINLEYGSLILNNAKVNNEIRNTYSVKSNSSTINDSTVVNRNASSSDTSYFAVFGNSTITNSTITCSALSTSYPCTALYSGLFNITNSEINGIIGVEGSVVMNSGSITGKTYGIKAECANVSVINGTVKAESNNAIDTYQNSSSYSYCNNSINIGTNSDKTVLGNPSIIATNGYGVNASDLVTVTYANGTINAKTYGIRAYSLSSYRNNRYYYKPSKIYIGTVLVDGEETPNPTITATNYGAYLYGVVDDTNKSEFVMARGSVSAYYPIYVNAGANTTNVVIGDTNDSDVSKTNPHIVATSSYPAITQSTNSFYIYDGLIEAARNKSYSGNITGVEPGYTLITEASGSNREKTYLDAPKIAKVNNVEYDSINEAVEAANNGDTIEILTAFTFVESIPTVEIPAGKEVTIDFKNFEINNKSTKTFIDNSGNLSIINIKNSGSDAPIINNGTMDITGASIVSSITNNSDLIINSGTYGSITNNSQLNVTAGTITNLINNTGLAELDGGTITKLTQKAGTVTSKANITTLDLVNGTVTLEDGAITNTTIKDGILNIGIKDGVVSETAPSLSKGITFPTENGVVNFYDGVIGNGQTTTGSYYITSEVNRDFFNDVETGYNIVENTGSKGLVLKQSNIIKNLDTEAEYTSIQDAIDAASNGDTLQLMKTYARTTSETTYTIPTGKNIKFDFNGNSIYTTSTLFENNGSLEIKTSEASSTNKYYLGIVNNGTLTTSGTLGLFNLVELTNNGNATIETVNMNTFNYTNNVGATLTLNSVLYRNSTEVNNGTETITDSTLYTTDMTNSGTLTYNTVRIYTANSDIKNSGTMDCNNITFYLRDFINEQTGVINLNSGLVENTTTSTRYITNRGILNSDKTNIKNITVKDYGTFNLKGMPDNLTQIVVPVQVYTGGAYYQTGGVNDSTIYGLASDSVISIKDSTVNTVDLREGADATIDNGKVTYQITTNNSSDNSIVNIKNNSEVQGVMGNSAPTTNFVVNVENSTLGTFGFTANANKYASDVTINLKNSTLGSTSNGYYSEGTSSNTRYYFRAKIDINAEDSDITGLLYVDNITMNGGSARAIRNSHSIPTSTYTEQLTKTCNLTDVTVVGNVICSDSIESTSTSVGGNIKTSILTLDRSDITGTVTAHQAEFTDSNITDNVYITDKGYSGGSLVMNSGTVSNGIDGSNASVTVKSGTVTKSGDNSVAINAKTVIIGDNDENVSTTDPVITADSSSINATDLYFYDGILTGGTVAYDVNHAYYPASYKTNIITVGGRSVATLVPLGEDETVADIDGNKFYADLLAAINDCTDGGTIKLHRDIELDEDIAWSDKSIIIDLNNHEILNIEHLLGSYTTIDSTDPGTGGAIYRFLANITGTEINPKNIIVYQMQDGNPLEADETYKLYKLIDSQYKLVKVNEESIGNYTVGNNEEIIRTVNGRVYLNGIGEGTYKLVSNNDREISFVISDNSISSNIKENPNYTSGTFIVSAVATLILTLQTGVIRYPYITVIIILLFLVGVSYILKKEKKQLE